MKRRQSGFTIVELLIVIVIIAILAAITVIAYNGLTQRARNNSRIQAASKLLNLHKAYIAANGSTNYLSLVGSNTNYCLGSNFSNPDNSDNTTTKSCNQFSLSGEFTSNDIIVSPNTTLDTEIAKYGRLDTSNYPKTIFVSSGLKTGQSSPFAIINSDQNLVVDGVAGDYGVIYVYLEGSNQNCGFGRQVVYTGSSGGKSQYSTKTGAKNESYTSTTTTCRYYFSPKEIN